MNTKKLSIISRKRLQIWIPLIVSWPALREEAVSYTCEQTRSKTPCQGDASSEAALLMVPAAATDCRCRTMTTAGTRFCDYLAGRIQPKIPQCLQPPASTSSARRTLLSATRANCGCLIGKKSMMLLFAILMLVLIALICARSTWELYLLTAKKSSFFSKLRNQESSLLL